MVSGVCDEHIARAVDAHSAASRARMTFAAQHVCQVLGKEGAAKMRRNGNLELDGCEETAKVSKELGKGQLTMEWNVDSREGRDGANIGMLVAYVWGWCWNQRSYVWCRKQGKR